MDNDLLKTFIEITQTRHFGKAAENLYVTQSTVSARIRHLEEKLGVALFARNRNDIQLTPSGLKLLGPAQQILDVWNKASQEITLQQEGKQILSIGIMASMADMVPSQVLAEMLQHLDDITLNLEIFSAKLLKRKLRDKSLDLSIMFDAPAEEDMLETQKIAQIPLSLVSSTADQHVSAAIVENYIQVDWGPSFASVHARKLAEARPIMRVDLGRTALEYLWEEGGSAYLAQAMVKNSIETGKLFLVAGAPIIERTLFAVYHVDNDKQILLDKCLELLLSMQGIQLND